jgi:hypothetical protein
VLMFSAFAAILIITWFTIINIRKGEICVKED